MKPKRVHIEMVSLSAIEPNPYRRVEKYPLDEEKIQGLMASFENSGFWDGSIQARAHPRKKSKYQIAFGHHRIEAAKRAGIGAVGLVISDRTDESMLRMMADENREEFCSDVRVTIETLAAVIEAYGRGEIELEAVTTVRKEAQYVLPGGKTYSLGTVARFLGWIKKSDHQATTACRVAFEAYLLRESADSAIESIPVNLRTVGAVKTVVTAVETARHDCKKRRATRAKTQEAEKAAATAAAQNVVKEAGFKKAKNAGERIGHQATEEVAGPKPKSVPDVRVYIQRISNKCSQLSPYAEIATEVRMLIPHLDEIDPNPLSKLADSLESMVQRNGNMILKLVDTLRIPDRAFRKERLQSLLEEVNR